MAETDPTFETDEVSATRGREQGLGVGARELEAQRDPGGVRTADADASFDDGVSVEAGDPDELDQSVGVQGAANDEDENDEAST